MLVNVFRDDIIEGLHKSAGIIPARTGAAFLRTIWLKADEDSLAIMSTDSNLEFQGRYPAVVKTPGLVGVQGRSFYDLVSRLPEGEITLRSDTEGNNLLIEQGARKYKLPTNDTSWFQSFSDYPEDHPVIWSGDFLAELIDKVAFCIADEDTMEAIACMYMVARKGPDGNARIETCGLNGHQFAMQRFVNDDIAEMLPEAGILVQKKYLVELKKWLAPDEIEMALGEKRLFFRSGSKTEVFSLPLSYYQYPDYTSFLGKVQAPGASKLTLDRMELTDSLRRIMIFNSENNRCTNLRFDGTQLELTSQGQDVGAASESLEVSFSGDLKRIAFPTKNLQEILSHFGSEQVSLTLTGAEGPCGVTGEGDPDYLVIIMPMKIVEETFYAEEDA